MSVLKNARHELFAQELAKIGATIGDSYIRAGYNNSPGAATRLSKTVKVASRVAEIKDRIFRKTEVSVERIVQELARIGFSDVTDVMQIRRGPRGKARVVVTDTDSLSPDVTAAIAGIKQTKEGVEVRFHDKTAALEKLARHVGMFKENINLNVTVSLVDLVLASYPAVPEPKVIEHEPE